jgi:outer membrane lipoprotein SlyB
MRRHVTVAAAALAAATFTLAGCSSGSNQSAATLPTSPSPANGAATSRAVAPGATDVPTQVPQNLNARKDVNATACGPTPGGYQMGGRIANTLGQGTTYKITAVFTDREATVIGYGVTDVSVPAGATKPWSVTATFKVPSRVICVLRGVDT